MMPTNHLVTPYMTYASFLSKFFEGKIQKLPVDVGFSCPVRDGTLSIHGCSFCNGRSFVPDMCSKNFSVENQLEKGKNFFYRRFSKKSQVGFLAYFQAGSNTYAPLEIASKYFEEALAVDQVRGLVIATRPDCFTSEWLDYLEKLARITFVMVELGVESVNEEVLHNVGRGHGVAVAEKSIRDLSERGIHVGVHMILGLPGESRESMLQQAGWVSALPVDVLKLHQLQILKGASMAKDYEMNPEKYALLNPQEFVELVVDYLELLNPNIAVERLVSQSPSGTLIAPKWGLKNDEVTNLVLEEFSRRHSFQGKYRPL